MTNENEEARKVLDDVSAYLASRASLENEMLAGHTFTDICNAIKILKQQPCEDCISREEVIKIFGEVHPLDYNKQSYIANIQKLPSVTPQQPSEDCISRTKLLSRIDAERKHLLDIKMDGAEHIIVHHARRIIEDMPSVTPQQIKWIPVSEMLPEKNGNYLVTVKYKPERDYDDIYTEYGEWRDGEWDVSGEYCGVIEDIIAYMPLPQPYNAESEDEE